MKEVFIHLHYHEYTSVVLYMLQLLQHEHQAIRKLMVAKNTTNELDIGKLMKALEGARIKYVFKQKNKDFFGLELVCGTSEEPLKMLIQHAEIFYYNNNNT